MYTLGPISSPQDIVKITSGKFSLGQFSAFVGEGFAIEVKRQSDHDYAIIRVISVNDLGDITFEWLYPYYGEVTGAP
jgi:hypothetical protein